MTRYERMTLGSFLLISAAYAAFFAVMTEGGQLSARMPDHMLAGLLAIFGFLAVGHIALWITTWSRRDAQGRPDDAVPDEREEQIELRADRWAYFLGEAGLFLLLVLAWLKWSGYAAGGSFTPTTPQGLIFAIVTLSALVALGRQLVGFTLSRRDGW